MVGLVARSWKQVVVGAVFGMGVAVAVMPPIASAKASYESPYPFDRTWNAALRLVRVDMGLKITEKDEQSGYLLFDYRSPESGNKITPGSMEVLRGRDDGAPVRVVVQLPQMPQYHEQMIVDALAAKMRGEYGEPPPKRKPAPSAPPAPTPPDAGPDAP